MKLPTTGFRSSWIKIRRSLSPCCPRVHETRDFRPTEMVRDMRGMRGKSRGRWMSASVGDQRRWGRFSPEGSAGDCAHGHELLQGGIHALAGYAVAASVGQGGVLGIAGEPALLSHSRQNPPRGSGRGYEAGCGLRPGPRRYRDAFLAGSRGFSTPAARRSA